MKRFKNILYFADGAAESCSALARAVSLARSNQARLTAIDVLEEFDSGPEIQRRFHIDLGKILLERRREALVDLMAKYVEAKDLIYEQVVSGVPFVEVIRAVLRNDYDLVIKAARPPEGLSERLLGSTDMHLLRKCPCPVWIDRSDTANPYRNVLAAVDPVDDDCGRLIMDLASSLAERESARLAVVHAWRLQGESMLLSGRARLSANKVEQFITGTRAHHLARLDALLRRYGIGTDDPAVHLVKGEPAPSIRELSTELGADLIVIGTVGRGGIPGLIIGNTAEEVLQTTQASVLAVKPEGFVSPVTDQ